MVAAGRATDAVEATGDWSGTSIALAVVTLVLMIGLRRVHPLFPSVLVAVGAAWILAEVLDADVARIGDLPTGFPSLSLDLPT